MSYVTLPIFEETGYSALRCVDEAAKAVGGKIEDRETFKGNTVYFEYDKSAIKSSELAKIAAVAEHLKSHADASLAVEGHCDERGTEEYNRSLSERRALSIRESLVNLGVAADRVTTEAFGCISRRVTISARLSATPVGAFGLGRITAPAGRR